MKTIKGAVVFIDQVGSGSPPFDNLTNLCEYKAAWLEKYATRVDINHFDE